MFFHDLFFSLNCRLSLFAKQRHLQCQRAANAMNDFRYSPNFNSQQWAEQFFKGY
jgi:hypothetical protein